MALLGLVFASVGLFRQKRGLGPILLIDDVSGELDRMRWSKFVGYMEERDYQVMITTANEAFRDELTGRRGVRNILVEDGGLRCD